MKKDIANRIRESRKASGLTLKALASKTHEFSQARIGNWEQGTRSPGPQEAKVLGAALGVSAAYLLGLSNSPKGDLFLNTEYLPRYVPLIALDQTPITEKSLQEIIKNLSPYSKDRNKVPLNYENELNAGPFTFAAKITDNSMSPEFKPSDIIIADPEREPKPGDFVIAQIGSTKIIRKYREISSLSEKSAAFELIPLNPDWAMSKISDPKEGKILATIVGQIKVF